MLEPIVEPVILGLETNEHAGRLAVAGDDDLGFLRFAKKQAPLAGVGLCIGRLCATQS